MPDRGGQGEDALQDPDHHAAGGAAAMLFEVELAFEGVVDRFDDLAQGLEQVRACPAGLALRAGRRSLIPALAMPASKVCCHKLILDALASFRQPPLGIDHLSQACRLRPVWGIMQAGGIDTVPPCWGA